MLIEIMYFVWNFRDVTFGFSYKLFFFQRRKNIPTVVLRTEFSKGKKLHTHTMHKFCHTNLPPKKTKKFICPKSYSLYR